MTNVLRTPVRVVLLVLWLIILAFGGMAQGKLSSVQTNDAAAFLPADAESTRAGEKTREFVDADAIPILIVAHREGSALAADDIAALQQAGEQLREMHVTAPSSGEQVTFGELFDAKRFFVIPAPDEQAALLPLQLQVDESEATAADGEQGVVFVVQALRDAIADLDLPAGVYFDVAGPGAIVGDLLGAFAGVDLLLLAVALGFVLVILLVVYRSPILPIAVLSADLFALCGAALVVYQLAKANILTLNGQSQGIMSILVIGATTDYALLLVARYREALGEHDSPVGAMAAALRGAAPAIIASAATVILGLLALLLSNLSSTSSLGPIAAIGIVSSLLVALTLLPAQLLIFGSRSRLVFWPATPPAPGTVGKRRDRGAWRRVARWVSNHDRPVWIATAVVLALFALAAPTFEANGTSDAALLRNAAESTRGNQMLDEHFDAGAAQPINVIIAAAHQATLQEQLAGVDGVTGVQAYRGAKLPGMQPAAGDGGAVPGPEPQTGHTAPPELGEPPVPDPVGDLEGGGPPPGVDPSNPGVDGPPPGVIDGADPVGDVVEIDGNILVNVATSHLPDDPRSWDTVAKVREVAHDLDANALVGGSAAEKLDTRDTAQADLWLVVPVTLIGIFVMLLLLLRSLVAPLILVAANVLSFLATMGACSLIFTHLLNLPGADPSVPLYGFVFLVALGIDYTIFLLTRVREEAHELPTKQALTKALATTGGVITSAGLVLAATFAVLVVIPLLFMLQLAVIVALGVLIDTFIVRTLLVSGLIHDLGEHSWWPAKLTHQRGGVNNAQLD